jgi:hypothetical protein
MEQNKSVEEQAGKWPGNDGPRAEEDWSRKYLGFN